MYLDGAYLPKGEARISPDDRGFVFGDGVYEVVRAYGGRPFRLEAHAARLRQGLAALRIASDGVHFPAVARELLARNGLGAADATVYIQVTRGAAPRTHRFPAPDVPPTVYATASPFQPRGDAEQGVAVITYPDIRWSRCDIKTVNLLGNCLANQAAYEAGAIEAVLVRDGVALEASASSLFGVFAGEVRTAPRSNYILPSITRQVVLELCEEAGLPARETPIFVQELAAADELFLAGTTLEVMPVVRVDGDAAGGGAPGPVTRDLQARFAGRTAAEEAVPL